MLRVTDIVPFEYQGEKIRVVYVDGTPWWVLADLCRGLGIANTTNTYNRLEPLQRDLRTINTPGGDQRVYVVNEAGMYSVILLSRKPGAEAFKSWITNDVLPTLRKEGTYTVPGREVEKPAPMRPMAPPTVKLNLPTPDAILSRGLKRIKVNPDGSVETEHDLAYIASEQERKRRRRAELAKEKEARALMAIPVHNPRPLKHSEETWAAFSERERDFYNNGEGDWENVAEDLAYRREGATWRLVHPEMCCYVEEHARLFPGVMHPNYAQKEATIKWVTERYPMPEPPDL